MPSAARTSGFAILAGVVGATVLSWMDVVTGSYLAVAIACASALAGTGPGPMRASTPEGMTT